MEVWSTNECEKERHGEFFRFERGAGKAKGRKANPLVIQCRFDRYRYQRIRQIPGRKVQTGQGRSETHSTCSRRHSLLGHHTWYTFITSSP